MGEGLDLYWMICGLWNEIDFEKVKVIEERSMTVQSQYKSKTDVRTRELEIEVNDWE